MRFTETVVILAIVACATADEESVVSCGNCDCPSDQKFDCGYYGIEESECTDKGCLWCPTETQGDPWCFFPDVGTDLTNCAVEERARVDCGYYGIAPAECETNGCCWAQSKTSGVPWCYKKN